VFYQQVFGMEGYQEKEKLTKASKQSGITVDYNRCLHTALNIK